MTTRDSEWIRNAPCKGAGETFFDNEDGVYTEVKAAVKTCGTCNYQAQCIDELVWLRSANGIWGGITAEQGFKLIEMWDDTDPYAEFGELAETVSWLLTP